MLKYLFRYEMARLIFGPLGGGLAIILFIVFGPTVLWLLNHWYLIIVALLLPGILTALMRPSGKYRR